MKVLINQDRLEEAIQTLRFALRQMNEMPADERAKRLTILLTILIAEVDLPIDRRLGILEKLKYSFMNALKQLREDRNANT